MILGYDFIFFALIIIAFILPFYIYRRVIFKKYYENKDFTGFIKDLQIYFQTYHPKIPLNINEMKNQKDIEFDLQKDLIIENALNQYIEFKYEKKTQATIKKELLWTSYENDSLPQKNSSPKDLQKRKEFLLMRDKNSCNRCGKSIKKDNSMIVTMKDIEDGGTYHFENLAILCQDCNRIVNSNNSRKVLKDLLSYNLLFKKFIK